MAQEPRAEGDEGRDRRWGTAEAWIVGIGVGLVTIALLGAAYSIGYNNGQGDSEPVAQGAGEPAAQDEKADVELPPAAIDRGREMFTQSCGSCHTLVDAETTGTTGPNLDVLQPEAGMVETAIHVGGTGTGAMPSGIYSGKQAEQVAAYVAAVAGEE